MRTPCPGAASAPRGPPGERKRGAPAPADAAVASSPKALPPRVVVELPDGGVYLGEDDARLEGERQETAQHLESVRRQAALPGTERFLELRRLLYATALETLVVTRKRHVAVLLTVDLVYMMMHVLTMIFRSRRLDEAPDVEGDTARTTHNALALSQFAVGIVLDLASGYFVIKDYVGLLRLAIVGHVAHFVLTCIVSWQVIAIFRFLIVLFLERLLAGYVEAQWVHSGERQPPHSRWPLCSFIQNVFMGGAVAGLRSEYVGALERSEGREAIGASGELVLLGSAVAGDSRSTARSDGAPRSQGGSATTVSAASESSGGAVAAAAPQPASGSRGVPPGGAPPADGVALAEASQGHTSGRSLGTTLRPMGHNSAGQGPVQNAISGTAVGTAGVPASGSVPTVRASLGSSSAALSGQGVRSELRAADR